MVNCLLISAFAYFLGSPDHSQRPPACEPLSVEVSTEKAGPSSNLGKIIVKYDDRVNKEDMVLHLFTVGGDRNRQNLKTTEITDLPQGKYILVITDNTSKHCVRHMEIQITP